VERCQVGGKIQYPQESIDYEEYWKKQAAKSGPSKLHLLALPCQNRYIPAVAIMEAENEFLSEALSGALSVEKDSVFTLIGSVNTMYKLLPAEVSDAFLALQLDFDTEKSSEFLNARFKTEMGLWSDEVNSVCQVLGLPALLPSSASNLPIPLDFLKDTWLPDFFLAPYDAAPMASFSFFEAWQYCLRKQGFLRHSGSQTLIGGQYGTVWLVRAILKVLLNCGAVVGKVTLLAPLPDGVDTSQISPGDWSRALDWCNELQTAIDETADLLWKTFGEQTGKHAQVQGQAEDKQAENQSQVQGDINCSFVDAGLLDNTQSEPPVAGPSKSHRLRPRPAFLVERSLAALDESVSGEWLDSNLSSSSDGNASDNFKPAEISSDEDAGSEDENQLGPTAPKKEKGVRKGEKRSSLKEPVPVDLSTACWKYELAYDA
jgi:hypothetical protein